MKLNLLFGQIWKNLWILLCTMFIRVNRNIYNKMSNVSLWNLNLKLDIFTSNIASAMKTHQKYESSPNKPNKNIHIISQFTTDLFSCCLFVCFFYSKLHFNFLTEWNESGRKKHKIRFHKLNIYYCYNMCIDITNKYKTTEIFALRLLIID